MGILRRGLLALSLANLLALPLWVELFRPGQTFLIDGAESLGTVAAVLLVAGALFLLSLTGRLLPGSIRAPVCAAVLLAMAGLVAWGAVKPVLLRWIPLLLGHWKLGVTAGLVALAAIAVVLVLRCPDALTRGIGVLLLALSPYAVFTIGQAIWNVWRLGPEAEALAYPTIDVPRLSGSSERVRTVVLLFDEFDYELAFGGSEPPILPVFRELTNQPGTLFATHAYPPMHSTVMSVPAMLTGRLVSDGAFASAPDGDLTLRFASGERSRFGAEQTLFSDLRSASLRSLRMDEAVLPPMRLAGPADADVVVPAAGRAPQPVDVHLRTRLADWIGTLPLAHSHLWDLKALAWMGLPHPSVRKRAIVAQMADLAANADVDVQLLHILLPHKPVVFDTREKMLGAGAGGDYRANLLATDMALGQILSAIKRSGRWERTHVVITTDHFYRNKQAEFGTGDHRIPFIVRLAGDQSPPLRYDGPFNTVQFRGLMHALVTGKVATTGRLSEVIRSGTAFGESPLTEYRRGW